MYFTFTHSGMQLFTSSHLSIHPSTHTHRHTLSWLLIKCECFLPRWRISALCVTPSKMCHFCWHSFRRLVSSETTTKKSLLRFLCQQLERHLSASCGYKSNKTAYLRLVVVFSCFASIQLEIHFLKTHKHIRTHKQTLNEMTV